MFWKHRFWKDVSARTIERVAAAAIAAAGAIAVAVFTPLVSWLGEDVAVPRWWFWMSLLGFVGAAFYLGYHYVWDLFFPSYRSYIQETFCGILWRWEWSKRGIGAQAEPCKIVPHCPDCDIELLYDQGYVNLGLGLSKAPTYKCMECGNELEYVPRDEARKRIMKAMR